MGNIGDFTVNICFVPDDTTMRVIMSLLNLWQEHHPDKMICTYNVGDSYRYEIVDKGVKE